MENSIKIFELNEIECGHFDSIKEDEFAIKVHSTGDNTYKFPPLQSFQLPYNSNVFELRRICWEEPDSMLLVFNCKLPVAGWIAERVKVVLGRCDSLTYGKFQLNFYVKRSKAQELLDTTLTLSSLINATEIHASESISNMEQLKAKGIIVDTNNKRSSFLFDSSVTNTPLNDIEKNNNESILLGNEISVESICFDKNRIVKFFDYRLINDLDFFLTFRDDELLKAIQEGDEKLKDYLLNTPRISLSEDYYNAYVLLFPEDTIEGKRYYSLACRKNCFRDDIFTGNRYYSSIPKTLDEKLSFLYNNSKLTDFCKNLQKIEYSVSVLKTQKYISTKIPYTSLFMKKYVEGLSAVEDLITQDRTLYLQLISAFKILLQISILSASLNKDLVGYKKNAKDAFFTLNIEKSIKGSNSVKDCIEVIVPDMIKIIGYILWWLKKHKDLVHFTARYQQFLQLYTVLEYAILRYQCYSRVSQQIKNCLKQFEEIGNKLLEKHIESLKNDSPDTLKELWGKLSSPVDFDYYGECAVTNKPPQMHQDYINKVLLQKTEAAKQKLEQEKRIAEAKVEERDDILKTVSHNIKNLIYSVTENLSDGVKEAPDNIRNSLQMALNGARAIQNMVRNIQMAYKYTFEQFLYDTNNENQEAYLLDDVVSQVLDVVVENMFTDEFKNERSHFFNNDAQMQNLKNDFYNLPQNRSEILHFVESNFTRIKIDIDNQLLQAKIGNTYGTLTNIYVLLNEFMMNSFKALAFVAPEKRFFLLEGRENENELIFIMRNSCCAESKDLLKAEGFGTFIANRIIESIGKFERQYTTEIFTLKLVIPKRKD